MSGAATSRAWHQTWLRETAVLRTVQHLAVAPFAFGIRLATEA